MKKKREEIVVVSYVARKTPRSSSYSQGRFLPSRNSHQACYTQASHPKYPPVYQNVTSTYRNVQAHYTKVYPQITKIHLPFTQIILHPTKFHLLNRVLLPTMLTCSRATEYPLLFIKSKFHYTKIHLRITSSIAKLSNKSISEKPSSTSKCEKIISRCLLLNKAVMTIPDPDLRRRHQGTSQRSLKVKQSCTSD